MAQRILHTGFEPNVSFQQPPGTDGLWHANNTGNRMTGSDTGDDLTPLFVNTVPVSGGLVDYGFDSGRVYSGSRSFYARQYGTEMTRVQICYVYQYPTLTEIFLRMMVFLDPASWSVDGSWSYGTFVNLQREAIREEYALGTGVHKINRRIHWYVGRRRYTSPHTIYFQYRDYDVPVPIGEWFLYEHYVLMHPDNGMFQIKVNGQELFQAFQRSGLRTIEPEAHTVIAFPCKVYGNYGSAGARKWFDDLELWNGLPDGPPPPPPDQGQIAVDVRQGGVSVPYNYTYGVYLQTPTGDELITRANKGELVTIAPGNYGVGVTTDYGVCGQLWPVTVVADQVSTAYPEVSGLPCASPAPETAPWRFPVSPLVGRLRGRRVA